MPYSIAWDSRLVRVDYSGEIENSEIQDAHFDLNGDGRFYNCDFLILNISDCDLSKVSVPDLFLVIATDFGATQTNSSLKVAMVTTNPINAAKAESYIERNQSIGTPWEFKLLPSIDAAMDWFSA